MIEKYPCTDLTTMNLDWVILKVKEMIAAWAETKAEWTDTKAEFEELKLWISNYFTNLDVQTEINNKLDAMALDGTLSDIIAPHVSAGLPAVVADQIGAVVAAQISAVVADQLPAVAAAQLPAIVATETAGQAAAWLEEHVDPDSGYVIDNSLEIAGAAADAKAAGDMIRELRDTTVNLYDKTTDKVGYTVDSSGVEIASPTWNVSKFIELEVGYRYYVKLFNATGDAAVRYALYDTNQDFTQRVIGANGETVKYLTTNNNSKYIRIITFNDTNPSGFSGDVMLIKSQIEPLEYIQHYTANDITARNYIIDKSIITVDKTNFVNDKAVYYTVSTFDEATADVSGVSYSPLIPVTNGRRVTLTNIYKYAYSYATCYDENQKCIGKIPATTTSGTTTVLVTIPFGTHYIRVNVETANLDILNVSYRDTDFTWQPASKFVNDFNTMMEGKALDLFNTLHNGTPIISFVDDDTSSLALVQRYYNAMNANNAVGNFAVITFRLDNDENLANQLLDYEGEGFGMLFHCNIQEDYFRDNPQYRDLALCEENITVGLRKMRSYNFNCYDLWAVPYGAHDADMVSLCKRHGLRALFSTANKNYVRPWIHANKWYIPRWSLNETDAVNPNFTMQGLKDMIDTVVANHGWLIVTTHVNEWGDTTAGESRLTEAIQYATNAGMQVKNVYEAYDIFRPLLDFNEMYS